MLIGDVIPLSKIDEACGRGHNVSVKKSPCAANSGVSNFPICRVGFHLKCMTYLTAAAPKLQSLVVN